jgi:hypothetical protein
MGLLRWIGNNAQAEAELRRCRAVRDQAQQTEGSENARGEFQSSMEHNSTSVAMGSQEVDQKPESAQNSELEHRADEQ